MSDITHPEDENSHSNSQNNGKSEVLCTHAQVRKYIKKYKNKTTVVRKTREKLGLAKRAATKVVDKVFEDMYSYEEYKKKEVRKILIEDLDDHMLVLREEISAIEEDIKDAEPSELGALRYHLNQLLLTYERYIGQYHKFFPGSIDLLDEEDQRPTKIQINKIVVQSPNRDELDD